MSGALNVMLGMSGAPGVLADELPSGGSVDAGSAQFAIIKDGTYIVSLGQTGNWITPASELIASFYQVRVDPTSGSFDGGSATGEWLDCTEDRIWSVTEPSNNTTKSVTFNVSFREKATQIVRKTYTGLILAAEDTIFD